MNLQTPHTDPPLQRRSSLVMARDLWITRELWTLSPSHLLLCLLSLCTLLCFGVIGCGDGLTETKSNGISLEPTELIFPPINRGQTSVNEVININHTGEAPLEVSDIYLEVSSEDQMWSRLNGCDRITEMIDPAQILVPEVLPLCSILISERPELPIVLNNSEFKQVMVTFRPVETTPIFGARLVVESNAQDNYRVEVPLNFSVGAPEIGGDRAIEFSSVGVNSDSYLIRNLGSAPLVIEQIDISPADPVNYPPYVDPETGESKIEFTWDSSNTLPYTIDQSNNNILSIQVTYDPQDEGVDQANMVIRSTTLSGTPLPDFTVLLTSESIPATLEITPIPIVFQYMSGQQDNQLVSFRNTGIRSLNAFTVTFEPEDAGFRFQSNEQNSFQIRGGEVHESLLTYQALSEATTATMIVQTDADNASDGEIRIPVTTNMSTGIKLLTADESTLNFNMISAGDSSSQTVTLSSNGTETVNITQVSLTESSDMDVFSVTEGGTGALNVGATQEINVTFTRPADEVTSNTYQATLKIESDSMGGDVLVNLIANP